MDPFLIIGLIGIFIGGILIGRWLAGFWSGQRGATNKEVVERMRALEQKCQMLDQRCEKLQEQVNEAHMLLTDERRLLDHKLAAMLPDVPAPSAGDEAARQKAAQRVRE